MPPTGDPPTPARGPALTTDWAESTIAIPGMDCVAEEQLVRGSLAGLDVTGLQVDLAARRVVVEHRASAPVLARLEGLGLGARLESTRPVPPPSTRAVPAVRPGAQERGVLITVLAINVAMFLAELVAGLLARSTGLVADSLDMLADAAVYAIALAAVGGVHASARRSARASGWLQLVLAGLVLLEVARRAVVGGEPLAGAMVGVSVLALAANLTCVALLARHREGGLHLRASWIFTTNDALANLAVIAAGALVAATGSAVPDLVIGSGIAVLIATGAVRILAMSR